MPKPHQDLWLAYRLYWIAITLLWVSCTNATLTYSQEENPPIHGASSPVPTRLPHVPRICAIGDLHGDITAARNALRLCGAIDQKNQWVGGNLTVVQTGDILDRGDTEKEILDLIKQLESDSAKSNGEVHTLIANHELMNFMGNFSFVSTKAFSSFNNVPSDIASRPQVQNYPAPHRSRAAAFLRGGSYANYYKNKNIVQIIGDTVFVHGGIRLSVAQYGVQHVNQQMHRWMKSRTSPIPHILTIQDQSPLWSRFYLEETNLPPSVCEELKQTLKTLGVKRMVVGHTVQPDGITSACENKVWRIDVGLSSFYKGPTQVLIIEDGKKINPVSVRKETK